MTQDEIIEMARQAARNENSRLLGCGIDDLKAFAKLVAAKAIAELESQEPVAHLWECLGRWSAYLVDNGTQADCAPPQWLVDAIKNATAPPQRTWIELTDDEYFALQMKIKTPMISVQDYIDAMRMVEQASKEKNT